ncbi:MAG: LysM peptidoglycan-binding domain-containing protein [Chlamydiales bacterium]
MCAKVIFAALLCTLPWTGWGAPPQPPNRPMQGEDINSILRQLRTGISDLKNEVRNHESEIRMFEERLHNQENCNENMRQQLSDDFQSQKDFARATNVNMQTKFDTFENRLSGIEAQMETLSRASDGVMNDLRQIKLQANDSVIVLGQYKQKLSELESLLSSQNQHIANLEAALQSIMELFQPKDTTPQLSKGGSTNKIYKVQPGDNLEKIAKANGISVQQLKEMNQLTNDRIIVGQSLKIP